MAEIQALEEVGLLWRAVPLGFWSWGAEDGGEGGLVQSKRRDGVGGSWGEMEVNKRGVSRGAPRRRRGL